MRFGYCTILTSLRRFYRAGLDTLLKSQISGQARELAAGGSDLQHFRTLVASAPVGILETDAQGLCVYLNPKWLDWAGMDLAASLDNGWMNAIHPDDRDAFQDEWNCFLQEKRAEFSRKLRFQSPSGNLRRMIFHATAMTANGNITGRICTTVDEAGRENAETERRQTGIEPRDAKEMECMARLATNVAHEINTPAQYIGDNIRFLQDALHGLLEVTKRHGELLQGLKSNTWTESQVTEAENLFKAVEVDYLATEIPKAINEALNGVERITRVVSAMKELSRPGSGFELLR